jgi:hypothetical protein
MYYIFLRICKEPIGEGQGRYVARISLGVKDEQGMAQHERKIGV